MGLHLFHKREKKDGAEVTPYEASKPKHSSAYDKFSEFNTFAKDKSEEIKNNPLKPRYGDKDASVSATNNDDDLSSHVDQTPTQVQEQILKPTSQESQTSAFSADQDIDFNDYPASKQKQQEIYSADGYQEDELDEDELEIQRLIRQTKDVRGETSQATGNIVNILTDARDSADNTIGVLAAQSAKMQNIETNLNIMETKQRDVESNVKELQHAQHMFHAPNFKKLKQKRQQDALLANKQLDRERDSELSGFHYKNGTKLAGGFKNADGNSFQSELAEQRDYDKRIQKAADSGYLTKDYDEEDADTEVKISQDISTATDLATQLHNKANLISSTIDNQNSRLKAIGEKVNKVDDGLTVQTNRIRGI
ncbi:unnamed protein product [Ambrosiozyma monospora]|uniref:Unnamed protein product n=1 Tax=Ambrosiozyma monospora TaxID=43982 RepID=A0A9W6YX70_AMBMO|nr:unnamed protein product [Ambrosiozyma monospora]